MTGRVLDEPAAAQVAAEEGLRIAEDIGDGFLSSSVPLCAGLGAGPPRRPDRVRSLGFGEVVEESIAANDVMWSVTVSTTRACALAYLGDVANARGTAAEKPSNAHPSLLSSTQDWSTQRSRTVHLAAGDASAAWEDIRSRARAHRRCTPRWRGYTPGRPLAPLTCGDLAAARRWADDVVSATTGWGLAAALTSRSRVEIAQGELDAADRDAYDALDLAARLGGDLVVPFALDCLADRGGPN